MINKRYWLVECKALSAKGKVVYVSKSGSGTDKPFDAMRYKTRREAREEIRLLRYSHEDWHAVEHIFTDNYIRRRTLRGWIIAWFNRFVWKRIRPNP